MARIIVNASGAASTPLPAGWIRVSFAAVGFALIALMIGFGFRQEWATRLWIWDDQRMNFIFLASIAAAVAAPALWVAVSGEFAAWAGVAITGIVAGSLGSAYLMSRVLRDQMPDARSTAVVFVALALLSVLSFSWSHPQPVRDSRPTPGFVRVSFFGFVAILVTTGGALLLQVDDVFPWRLDPPVSTLFGSIFLGAAGYFAYALHRPMWVISAGALWSFLIYDIVLAIPYARMLGDESKTGGYGGPYGSSGPTSGDDVNELSLAVYLLVLGLSAAVALYAFLLNAETRVWGQTAPAPVTP